jgi:hypothetical protein
MGAPIYAICTSRRTRRYRITVDIFIFSLTTSSPAPRGTSCYMVSTLHGETQTRIRALDEVSLVVAGGIDRGGVVRSSLLGARGCGIDTAEKGAEDAHGNLR